MAGLFDFLSAGPSSGGLLDFLSRNSMASIANNPGAMPSDMAQYGSSIQPQYGSTQQPQYGNAGAPVPQNPPPVISAPPAAAPTSAPSPSYGSGLGGNLLNPLLTLTNSRGLIPALGNTIASIATGQRMDPTGIALQQQGQTANLTARMLMSHGYSPADAVTLVQPGNTQALADALKQISTQGTYTQETDKDGNVWNINRQTGQKTIALAAKDDKFQNVAVKNPDGSESIRTLNTKTGEYGPPQGPVGNNSAIPGDASKSGSEYIATLPTAQANTVKGMLDGTIQPPSSFAASKPYWQQMIAAAKQADPTWDENNWAARHKMSVDLASSGNSSWGGIFSNGASSFSHLADLSKSMAGLGNASHDFIGGGAIAHAQNYIANSAGGSDTQAKIKAINDNLGHYGQESTKFYSGTGGGAEERMNALKEMNPAYTSSEEMAAYLEKEKGLMMDRLTNKFQQLRDIMGDEQASRIIARKMPDLQKSLDAIDANVAKLRGMNPSPAAPASLKVGQSAKLGNVTIKKVSE